MATIEPVAHAIQTVFHHGHASRPTILSSAIAHPANMVKVRNVAAASRMIDAHLKRGPGSKARSFNPFAGSSFGGVGQARRELSEAPLDHEGKG